MIFEYDEYYSASFKFPIFLLILGIIFTIIGIYAFLKTPCENIKNTIRNILLLIVPIYFLIIPSSMQLRYGFHLINETKMDSNIIIGEIENIENIKNSPRYYYNGRAVHASIVTINGEKLYFMTIGDLEVGDYVKVEYLPKSTFVLKVEESSET